MDAELVELPEVLALLVDVIDEDKRGMIATAELAARIGWDAESLGEALRRAGMPAATPTRQRIGIWWRSRIEVCVPPGAWCVPVMSRPDASFTPTSSYTFATSLPSESRAGRAWNMSVIPLVSLTGKGADFHLPSNGPTTPLVAPLLPHCGPAVTVTSVPAGGRPP